ncbi:MAG: flagellin [Spirochaetes bacterium GWB1_36_13]|nr:MAG: flagellin [Spirochaetes bacterium GWB1_36_13]
MIINHNMSSIYANRFMKLNEGLMDKNIERLSAGEKITRASDDASGLAVSEKMRTQIKGLNQAGKNVQNAVSFVQTTEGFLAQTQSIIQRVRELAIQAANGIYSSEDRMQIQVEVSQLVDEVNRIASHAQFNGFNMLTGRFSRPTVTNTAQGGVATGAASAMYFQVGANMDQKISINIGSMSAEALKLTDTQQGGERKLLISLSTPEKANSTIGRLDEALKVVSKQRADLGAYQNRMEKTLQGIWIAQENIQAAESRIRDTDMAAEMADFTKNQILSQSTTAMLAQANVKSQAILKLLQ